MQCSDDVDIVEHLMLLFLSLKNQTRLSRQAISKNFIIRILM